jgi:CRISPR-associated protein Cas1
MAWRGLHVTKRARLSLAEHQVVIEQEDGATRLPIEDLAWVVLDTPQATLTTALLAACMEQGVALVTTNARHTPSGLILPFHGHYRQAGVAAMQAGCSTPLRKRLWQTVIRAKIANQATNIDRCGGDGCALFAMVTRVASGDPDNIEARAARDYWQALFPAFRRGDEADKRNMLLNYGYAVIRAAVARGLVAAGLLPAFGIGHANAANAFNLADDMVEPFRPFVDRVVWNLAKKGTVREGEPSLAERQVLAGLPLEPVRIGRETMTLLAATEAVAAGLVRAFDGQSAAMLKLPTFPPISAAA